MQRLAGIDLWNPRLRDIPWGQKLKLQKSSGLCDVALVLISSVVFQRGSDAAARAGTREVVLILELVFGALTQNRSRLGVVSWICRHCPARRTLGTEAPLLLILLTAGPVFILLTLGVLDACLFVIDVQ
jgi:hypothetical protein